LCAAGGNPTKEVVVVVVVVVVIMAMMCRFHCVAVAASCQAAPTDRVHLSARVCQGGSHSRFHSSLNQIQITFQPDIGCMAVAVVCIVTDSFWMNRWSVFLPLSAS
jgi:uncharacterized membrane protein YjgN (DUF898 family)